MMSEVSSAQDAFLALSQEDCDRVTHAVAREADRLRVVLARLAVEETGMGLVEDKVVKNHFATEYVWAKHVGLKTVGVVSSDPLSGIEDVAEPVGPIASLVPCTNPTSTVIFNIVNCMKTRNALVLLPHPRAQRVCLYAAELLSRAAERAGAPRGAIKVIRPVSLELSSHVMAHEKIRFVLATGGNKMVRAAYASGKPAIAVGAGNCAVVIDETADLDAAVGLIVAGKTFDNGVICATEQAAVVVDEVFPAVLQRMAERGVHFLHGDERERLAGVFWRDGGVNIDVVGKPAVEIAAMAGVDVPSSTVCLGVMAEEVGPGEPFSHEKLCPVLALYRAPTWDSALDVAESLVRNDGLGHSSALHTDPDNIGRIREFERRMPTHHNIVNMPSSLGAIGGPYNPSLEPSLTLGVGTINGSSFSLSLGPEQLLNIKRTAQRRDHIEWFKVPQSVYFNRNVVAEALQDLALRPRGEDAQGQGGPSGGGAAGQALAKAMLITDRVMVELGMVDTTIDTLKGMGFAVEVWDKVTPDPTMSCVRAGAAAMERFAPDVLVAFGGGSAIDAAKVMRMVYEHPEYTLEDMALRFIEIRHRVVAFPQLGSKVKTFVCIPTTSGTGAEMTPFAVITDDDGVKYPITSYALVPDCAIVDTELALSQPPRLASYCGLDALTHALESLVSTYASDFTVPLSMSAAETIMANLAPSVLTPHWSTRGAVHKAASIAGMAFGNAFLGVGHSLAHQLGARLHVPHGLACALVVSHVVVYNSSRRPTRMGVFAQYTHPQAMQQYARLAGVVGCAGGAGTDEEKVDALVGAIEDLKRQLSVPPSIAEAVSPRVTEEEFMAAVDGMAERAFDDQCTGTNPRYPLIAELRQILVDAWHGPPAQLAADDDYAATVSGDGISAAAGGAVEPANTPDVVLPVAAGVAGTAGVSVEEETPTVTEDDKAAECT